MMRQMRDQMKLIMIVTSVAFVGLMVFGWGMDISGRSGATNGQLGKVNGQPVSYEEFNTVYRNLYDQQQQAQKTPISAAMTHQLEDAAWQQVVTQKLIEQELQRRGIGVSDQEIREAAKYSPPPDLMKNAIFQTDGKFDPAKYQRFLASPAVDNQLLLQLEAYYRELIPRSKLYAQVTAGSYVPESELWSRYQDAHETAKVRFILIDPARVVPAAAITVTDAEIKQYYDSHQDEFKRPANATIEYAAIDKSPNAADTAAAKARADSVRAEIAGGKDFAEVAKAESADQGSAAQGGELGVIHKGQTVPAFEQAVWSLKVGALSEPVLTRFGYHIIQVESRSDDQATVRHILIPIKASQQHEDQLLTAADSLEKLGESMTLPEAAKQMGLEVRTTDLNQQVPVIPGVGRVDDGADWIFAADTHLKDVSQVFEAQNAFYMVQLDARTPAGVLSLVEATPLIRGKLTQQKRLVKARDVGRQMVDELQSGKSLEQVAQNHDLKVQEAGPFTREDFVPGLGREDAAIGTAFGLKPGENSGLVESNDLLYIIQSEARTPADRKAFEAQKQLQRAQLMASLNDQRWTDFLASLREKATIVDNRAKVLRAADDNAPLPQQQAQF